MCEKDDDSIVIVVEVEQDEKEKRGRALHERVGEVPVVVCS